MIGISIGLLIENIDQCLQDYSVIKDVFCLGYVDYIYEQKYGLCDYCGGGCFFVCEIVMCVVVGVIVKKYLVEKFGIEICGCLIQMGDILLEIKDWCQVEFNLFFCFDVDKFDVLDELMCVLKKEGDFIGVKVMVMVSGVLVGFGELVFD